MQFAIEMEMQFAIQEDITLYNCQFIMQFNNVICKYVIQSVF